jgi:lysylphosphatidylglycerol synthetase-like protein (DUF2156 family)
MNPFLRPLKAIYNFFAGDAIILIFVATAFGMSALLARIVHAPNTVIAAALVGLITLGLVLTLIREARGSPSREQQVERRQRYR